ncbi:hypothetical protein ABZS77_12865 [Micromonospora sp. NPDC005298]|uniref:hypothetical protein n=1 Tax=Micromonospora sp. NPDC005298 TaxID=3156873 RepID=UPI0033B0A434
MLPVAFTCPLWWVARWATRVLTSLAVVAALAFGAGASPASAAGHPTSAGTASAFTVGPVAGPPSTTSAFAAGPSTTSGRAGAVVAVGHGSSVVADDTADRRTSTGPTDPQPARLALHLLPGVAGDTPVRASGAERQPHADGPATRAPRAPPAR